MHFRSRRVLLGGIVATVTLALIAGCSNTVSRAWTPHQAKVVYAELSMKDVEHNMALVQKCAASQDVSVTPNLLTGSYSYDLDKLSPDESVRYGEVVAACAAKKDPNFTRAQLSQTQAKHLYELEIVQASCLRRVGLQPSPPSTEAAFVQAVSNRKGYWDPMASVGTRVPAWGIKVLGPGSTPSQSFGRLADECPSPGRFHSSL